MDDKQIRQERGQKVQRTGMAIMGAGCLMTILVTVPLIVIMTILL